MSVDLFVNTLFLLLYASIAAGIGTGLTLLTGQHRAARAGH
jgi:hypothetical protein